MISLLFGLGGVWNFKGSFDIWEELAQSSENWRNKAYAVTSVSHRQKDCSSDLGHWCWLLVTCIDLIHCLHSIQLCDWYKHNLSHSHMDKTVCLSVCVRLSVCLCVSVCVCILRVVKTWLLHLTVTKYIEDWLLELRPIRYMWVSNFYDILSDRCSAFSTAKQTVVYKWSCMSSFFLNDWSSLIRLW